MTISSRRASGAGLIVFQVNEHAKYLLVDSNFTFFSCFADTSKKTTDISIVFLLLST